MKVVICTSNGIRHKFFANSITSLIDETLIISESNPNDANQITTHDTDSIIEHFNLRYKTEMETVQNNDYFCGNVVPLIYREINLNYTFDIIKKFNPDAMLVFGSSIIKEPSEGLVISSSLRVAFSSLLKSLSITYSKNKISWCYFISE